VARVVIRRSTSGLRPLEYVMSRGSGSWEMTSCHELHRAMVRMSRTPAARVAE
jgi:hypothetical protein